MDRRTDRIVNALARRYERPGLEADDLRQEAYLHLLTAKPRPAHVAPGTWAWQQVRDRLRAVCMLRCHRRHEPLPAGIYASDQAEWTDWLHDALSTLSDPEAESVILACGLDGGPTRPLSDVAWMMSHNKGNTYRRYERAIGKLRAMLKSA
jgi:DNA-directed RNA polymerase specialized sigma24 family protein